MWEARREEVNNRWNGIMTRLTKGREVNEVH